jgi:hypothetical protein
MLRLVIDSRELDLVERIFYARRGRGIPAINIGKVWRNFIKREAFDVQEFNNMTLS